MQAGCSTSPTLIPIPSKTIQFPSETSSITKLSSETGDSTSLPIDTQIPSKTYTPILTTTPPIVSTPTPIKLPLQSFEQHCVEIKDSIPEGFLSEGTIFIRQGWYRDATFYEINSQHITLNLLPDIQDGSANGVSPDGKWLAFRGSINDRKRLFILGPSGEVQTTFIWKNQWIFSQSWLDSERLVMVFEKKDPIAVDILNPFTGRVQTLNPDLNDIYVFRSELPGPNSLDIWKLVYDPSMTRLVYLRGNDNLNETSMVMVDLNTGQTIWEFESPGVAHDNMPVWSPDGENLLFVSTSLVGDPFQLFTIDKNGAELEWVNIPQAPGQSNEWSWSPDSQSIAFFNESGLYLLDTKTHQLLDLCISNRTGFDEVTDGLIEKIFWSPDSSQILFQRYDAPALVIDLISNIAAPIVGSSNFQPIGWISGE